MAIVAVSLDTTTRQAVLTINGVLVPSDEFNISKWLKYDKKDEFEINFSYSIDNVDGNGMKERRSFYLPSAEDLAAEAHLELNEDGFASKAIHDDEKAKADTIDFLKRSRNK
jgi:hypothetical protein